MRDMETPMVLRPGIFSTLAPVTRDPMVLFVGPGLEMPINEKSEAEIVSAGLHV